MYIIINKSLVTKIHKLQTHSETRNVYMAGNQFRMKSSFSETLYSDFSTVMNLMIYFLMTYNSNFIQAQVTPIPISCREL